MAATSFAQANRMSVLFVTHSMRPAVGETQLEVVNR